ncbi:MAG: DNA repair protein RecO [Gammaproteobacteria bacterium]|nr:MAG: DNA repair protein RecO [Gammaproteobacteria bacterium]
MQPAWVLHGRPYRETSLLLEALTRDQGRVPLVARGARRGRVPQSLTLQPFRPLMIDWLGRGELLTLKGAEPAGPALNLTGERLFSGFYANELLMRLLHRHEPAHGVFLSYGALLEGLAGEAPLEPLLRRYEIDLLTRIGYAPLLDRLADGDEAIDAGGRYHYQADRGPLKAPAPGTLEVSGELLLALAEDRLDDPGILRQAKLLTRHLLRPHLGGRPLLSRRLFGKGGS